MRENKENSAMRNDTLTKRTSSCSAKAAWEKSRRKPGEAITRFQL
jgi:hypothetical protein